MTIPLSRFSSELLSQKLVEIASARTTGARQLDALKVQAQQQSDAIRSLDRELSMEESEPLRSRRDAADAARSATQKEIDALEATLRESAGLQQDIQHELKNREQAIYGRTQAILREKYSRTREDAKEKAMQVVADFYVIECFLDGIAASDPSVFIQQRLRDGPDDSALERADKQRSGDLEAATRQAHAEISRGAK